jgi:hypothetical protein
MFCSISRNLLSAKIISVGKASHLLAEDYRITIVESVLIDS